jgi:fatty acid CoA ligase FadD9
MPIDTRDERLERRIADLNTSDPQFAAATPDDAISAAIERPDLRLAQLVKSVFDGYADRPALGARAVELTTDPDTGRTTAALLPYFDTITYGELAERVDAITNALADDPAAGATESPCWASPASITRRSTSR